MYDLGISPHPGQKLTIRIELDTQPHAGAANSATLIRRHVIMKVVHHDKASLLAGKLNAILTRQYVKGRDLFDLVWYLSDTNWPSPNFELLNNALSQFDWKGGRLEADNWKQILWEVLSQRDIHAAARDVTPFLLRKEDRAWVSRDHLEMLLVGLT